MTKANDRFFTWCSSIPRCKQQARGISPSVKPLKIKRLDSSLLRGSRGGSAAYHRFSAAQKV